MHSLMESIYSSSSSNKSSKAAKVRNPKGGVSPLMIKYLNSSSNSSSSSSVDPFSPSPYGTNNSGSPLSAVDDEDVLVMDGILVSSSNNSGFYKTEICRSWDDFGKCRFGAKCQFAHGKEEVRPSRFPVVKNKSEICRSNVTGSCLYGSKCRFVHQMMTDSALVLTSQTDSPTKPEHTIKTPNTPLDEYTNKTQVITPTAFKLEQPSKTPSITIIYKQTNSITESVQKGWTSITSVNCKDKWSPQDDGIEVVLPLQPDNSTPSRQDVDAYIDGVLYQPSARRRLPVFEEICPE